MRAAEAFRLGHLPLAVNVPATVFERHLRQPEALAAALGEAGVDQSLEAVVVSEGGLNERSALALMLFERIGQARVSLLLDSTERWAELGHEVARPAATPQPGGLAATPALRYAPRLREGTVVDGPAATSGRYPRVYIASGRTMPAREPPGTLIHLPYPEFLNADATPRAASDIWRTLDKAGVPRYAEIVLFADSPGEAAVNYLIFRMMGFADVKVWLR